MAPPPATEVTQLLLAWRAGNPDALDRLLPRVYTELHKLAHGRLHAEASGPLTLQTTALVNEAYLRLVDGARVEWHDRTHFFAVCARLMRRILVDRARARYAEKRGGRERPATLGDWHGAVRQRDDEVLALHEALDRLASANARMATIVELRYFGGLTLDETAAAIGMSPETVTRDWKVARMWLRRELRSLPDGPSGPLRRPRAPAR